MTLQCKLIKLLSILHYRTQTEWRNSTHFSQLLEFMNSKKAIIHLHKSTKGNTELRKIVNSFLAWHCKLSSTNSRKVNISLTLTSINAFNSARHVLNSPTSQTFMNGLQKRKQIGLQPVT